MTSGRVASPTPSADQVAMWDALDRLTMENRRPPVIRELMQAVGKRSTSATIYKLARGIQFGRVSQIGNHYVPAWWARMLNENMEKYYGKHNSN